MQAFQAMLFKIRDIFLLQNFLDSESGGKNDRHFAFFTANKNKLKIHHGMLLQEYERLFQRTRVTRVASMDDLRSHKLVGNQNSLKRKARYFQTNENRNIWVSNQITTLETA